MGLLRLQAAKAGLWEKQAPGGAAAPGGAGSGLLFDGRVVEVVSGDTLNIKTSTGQQIRMSLARCAIERKRLLSSPFVCFHDRQKHALIQRQADLQCMHQLLLATNCELRDDYDIVTY